MTRIHNLGFPRIGVQRELKRAQEAYWAGKQTQEELLQTGKALRARHWEVQARAGVDLIPVGDFAWYDQILEWTTLLGAVPPRFEQNPAEPVDLDTLFRVARGRAPTGKPAAAAEMTKWFDTNYHYIVPELAPEQSYRIAREYLFEQVAEAQALGHKVKPVIPGPLTWLWLGKGAAYPAGAADTGKLALLNQLLPVYVEVLTRLQSQGVEWVQMDEPILVLDLPEHWRAAFTSSYQTLAQAGVSILLATYFEGLRDNLPVLKNLPVHGVHVDLVRAPEQLQDIVAVLGQDQILSAGIVNGRNIWRTDLDAAVSTLAPVKAALGDRLWIAPSCSLLHVPVDLTAETELDGELRQWLSFATQKLDELRWLGKSLDDNIDDEARQGLEAQRQALAARGQSTRIHNAAVQARLAQSATLSRTRAPFAQRIEAQKALNLPAFPTTTIGSFPQTAEIRTLRRDWKTGALSDAAYEQTLRGEIEKLVRFQENIGLDVLVHGEFERNDMVEYFGELLGGYAFTQNGWVQSYGSRCVKPPVIFGDVVRPTAMTVAWSMVICARRSTARNHLPPDRPGTARRGERPGSGGLARHPDRRAGLSRRLAAAPRRLASVSGLGGGRLSPVHQRRRRHNANPYAYVLFGIQ